MSQTFNIYCDESCHLENDHQPVIPLAREGHLHHTQVQVSADPDASCWIRGSVDPLRALLVLGRDTCTARKCRRRQIPTMQAASIRTSLRSLLSQILAPLLGQGDLPFPFEHLRGSGGITLAQEVSILFARAPFCSRGIDRSRPYERFWAQERHLHRTQVQASTHLP
jgi:hypothetical protein